MYIRFILLFLLMSSSQASIPASMIDSDASEVVSLNEGLVSSSPDIFQQSNVFICEMISKCCPYIKTRLDNYGIHDIGGSKVLMEACLGNHSHRSPLQTCPILSQVVTITQNEDFYKYIDVLSTVAGEILIPTISIPSTCSSDELYATLCDRTERHKMISCERKKFAYIAQHTSDDDYRTYARQTKQNIRLIINAINKAFPKENVIITTITSNATLDVKTNLLLLVFSIMEVTYYIFKCRIENDVDV